MTFQVNYNEGAPAADQADAKSIADAAQSECSGTTGATYQGFTYDAVNGQVVVNFRVESDTGAGDAYSTTDTIIANVNSAANAGLDKASNVSQGRPF